MARIQAEMRIWKKRREGERKETGNTRLLLISPAPEPINRTLKINRKNQPGHCCHSSRIQADMETLDEELAYALWPGDINAGNLTAASIAGQKMKLSTKIAKTEAHFRINAQTTRCRSLRPSAIFGLVRERPIDIHKDPVALTNTLLNT